MAACAGLFGLGNWQDQVNAQLREEQGVQARKLANDALLRELKQPGDLSWEGPQILEPFTEGPYANQRAFVVVGLLASRSVFDDEQPREYSVTVRYAQHAPRTMWVDRVKIGEQTWSYPPPKGITD